MMDSDSVEELTSRALSDEDRYYYERSYKEPVESIDRLEDAAKFLVGATATTSGLFLAAVKLSRGDQTATEIVWFIPFVLWAMSIVVLVCVLLPQEYKTGQREPDSWRKAFLEARRRKFRRLMVGALFFVMGIISAVIPLSF